MNRLTTTVFTAVALACSGSALAGDGDLTTSIDACRTAISQQLKAEPASLNINVGKMKVLARARSLVFKVNSYDAAGPVHGVTAKCVTKLTGEVTELTLDGKATTLAAVGN